MKKKTFTDMFFKLADVHIPNPSTDEDVEINDLHNEVWDYIKSQWSPHGDPAPRPIRGGRLSRLSSAMMKLVDDVLERRNASMSQLVDYAIEAPVPNPRQKTPDTDRGFSQWRSGRIARARGQRS